MANGQLFLAREDHVDFYNNILTLKIKSEAELKVAELRGDIVPEGGMRVVAVGRTFYTYSFIDYEGELYQGYPDFGSHELVRSSCSTSHQVLYVFIFYCQKCIIESHLISYKMFV